KYYDNYPSLTGLKGDATNADGTQSWYNDTSGFVLASHPWFVRGGNYNNAADVGVFYTYNGNGVTYNGLSARMVAKP
ncbi:MAG: hypothetical protein RR047_03195, partial [Bacilli bacterium]